MARLSSPKIHQQTNPFGVRPSELLIKERCYTPRNVNLIYEFRSFAQAKFAHPASSAHSDARWFSSHYAI